MKQKTKELSNSYQTETLPSKSQMLRVLKVKEKLEAMMLNKKKDEPPTIKKENEPEELEKPKIDYDDNFNISKSQLLRILKVEEKLLKHLEKLKQKKEEEEIILSKSQLLPI